MNDTEEISKLKAERDMFRHSYDRAISYAAKYVERIRKLREALKHYADNCSEKEITPGFRSSPGALAREALAEDEKSEE